MTTLQKENLAKNVLLIVLPYENIRVTSCKSRMLAHITTGLLMLIIGLSLEMTAVLATVLVGSIPILNFSLLLLYIASVFYDIWDVERLSL